jgi:chemotaxis protein methyltransferase CheR
MTPQESGFLRRILKEHSGLRLGLEKQELLETRVMRLLKEHQLDSVSALCSALLRGDGESLRWRLAEIMAVQESYFFRDKGVFACLENTILPKLMAQRAPLRRLRIWCAAAATGQEPYSLAMLLAEKAETLKGWNVEILATDFSEEALLKARAGVYSQFEVQRGLPVTLLVKYFRRVGGGWELDPEIRSKVQFRQQNLLHNSRRHGVFDLILCRNVLIYFDEETKRDVITRLTEQIAEGGYFLLGATETVLGFSDRLVALPERCPGVFRLLGGAEGRTVAEPASVTRLQSSQPHHSEPGRRPASAFTRFA